MKKKTKLEEEINETKSWFGEKTNETDKLRVRLRSKTRRQTEIANIRNEKVMITAEFSRY